MYRFFWTLPGPASFLDAIQSDLEEGKLVFLTFPATFPADGIQQLKILLRERLGDRHWRDLNFTNECGPPIEVLKDKLVPPSDIYIASNIQNLITNKGLSGFVGWFKGLPPSENWTAWVEFFSDYQHSLQHYPAFKRPVFCLPIQDQRALHLPASDTCLSHRRFSGVIGRLDMRLLVSWILRKTPGNHLRKRLLTAVISEIAGADVNLCFNLCQLSPEKIFSPFDFLMTYAEDHNFQKDEIISDPCTRWLKGVEALYDNQLYTHSAQLTINEDQVALERRLWRAQVGILFPILEDIRQEIILKKSTILTVPHNRPTGEIIEQKLHLELGDIKNQFSNNRKVGWNAPIFNLVKTAKEIRDKLAHFQHVELSMIESVEFQDYENVVAQIMR